MRNIERIKAAPPMQKSEEPVKISQNASNEKPVEEQATKIEPVSQVAPGNDEDEIVIELPPVADADSAVDIDVLFKEFLFDGVDFTDLEVNLTKELAALESANVHALFHATDASSEISAYVNEGKGTLDDIENSIKMYSTNLSVSCLAFLRDL